MKARGICAAVLAEAASSFLQQGLNLATHVFFPARGLLGAGEETAGRPGENEEEAGRRPENVSGIHYGSRK